MFSTVLKQLDADIEASNHYITAEKEALRELLAKRRNIAKLQEQANRVLGIREEAQLELTDELEVTPDEQTAVLV